MSDQPIELCDDEDMSQCMAIFKALVPTALRSFTQILSYVIFYVNDTRNINRIKSLSATVDPSSTFSLLHHRDLLITVIIAHFFSFQAQTNKNNSDEHNFMWYSFGRLLALYNPFENRASGDKNRDQSNAEPGRANATVRAVRSDQNYLIMTQLLQQIYNDNPHVVKVPGYTMPNRLDDFYQHCVKILHQSWTDINEKNRNISFLDLRQKITREGCMINDSFDFKRTSEHYHNVTLHRMKKAFDCDPVDAWCKYRLKISKYESPAATPASTSTSTLQPTNMATVDSKKSKNLVSIAFEAASDTLELKDLIFLFALPHLHKRFSGPVNLIDVDGVLQLFSTVDIFQIGIEENIFAKETSNNRLVYEFETLISASHDAATLLEVSEANEHFVKDLHPNLYKNRKYLKSILNVILGKAEDHESSTKFKRLRQREPVENHETSTSVRRGTREKRKHVIFPAEEYPDKLGKVEDHESSTKSKRLRQREPVENHETSTSVRRGTREKRKPVIFPAEEYPDKLGKVKENTDKASGRPSQFGELAQQASTVYQQLEGNGSDGALPANTSILRSPDTEDEEGDREQTDYEQFALNDTPAPPTASSDIHSNSSLCKAMLDGFLELRKDMIEELRKRDNKPQSGSGTPENQQQDCMDASTDVDDVDYEEYMKQSDARPSREGAAGNQRQDSVDASTSVGGVGHPGRKNRGQGDWAPTDYPPAQFEKPKSKLSVSSHSSVASQAAQSEQTVSTIVNLSAPVATNDNQGLVAGAPESSTLGHLFVALNATHSKTAGSIVGNPPAPITNNNPLEMDIDLNQEPFRCDECSELFDTQSELLSHSYDHFWEGV